MPDGKDVFRDELRQLAHDAVTEDAFAALADIAKAAGC